MVTPRLNSDQPFKITLGAIRAIRVMVFKPHLNLRPTGRKGFGFFSRPSRFRPYSCPIGVVAFGDISGKVRVLLAKRGTWLCPFLSSKCVFAGLKISARLRAEILQIRGKTGHFGVKTGITISSSSPTDGSRRSGSDSG